MRFTVGLGHIPEKELPEIYKVNDGQYVTPGSDVHIAEDPAADYNIAKELLTDIDL